MNMLALLSIKIKKIERSDSTNIQYSIFNLQFRLAGLGVRISENEECER
ncbi:hypothetical protein D1AOALGA4SA_6309 [Olavius algarvensis Delta 1 endosymbiont]|nr:hypothetical protein D1AOALGA4SA_6309 [Olavius algarvensis Delta 1 endosymbiont]